MMCRKLQLGEGPVGLDLDPHSSHLHEPIGEGDHVCLSSTWSDVLAKLVEQAWEMGERELILIHGNGRNRGITPGFVNTNTGFFGCR